MNSQERRKEQVPHEPGGSAAEPEGARGTEAALPRSEEILPLLITRASLVAGLRVARDTLV